MSIQVGVIGLGHMGRAVARRLHAGGYRLVVWNRTREKAEALLQLGARAVDKPGEVVEKADVIFTLLSDDEAMRSLALGTDGIASAVTVGKTLIDMSTLTEAAITDVNAAVRKAGGRMLHAPILGGPLDVFTGNATICAGGARNTYNAMLPLLETISRPVHLVGEIHHGTRMKMALNIMLSHFLTGISSSLAFGKKGDLPQTLLLDILSRVASTVVEKLGSRMLSGDRGVTFTMKNLEKDHRYFRQASEELGLDLPTIRAAHELFESVVKDGAGDEDLSSIYNHLLGTAKD